MSDQSNASGDILSLPRGGGALTGIGEKFSPDLHTGTGNFTVPVAIPPGRNGFQPDLNLVYSTGNGNGPFGLGWNLSIPGVSRKTSGGVPRYNEKAQNPEPGERQDVFILSGTEDLVPVAVWEPDPDNHEELRKIENPGQNDWATAPVVQYRPRTEGLFARIFYYRESEYPHWKIESKDGLVSTYGGLSSLIQSAVLSEPDDSKRIFAWKLTETKDPFGNRICYDYSNDPGEHGNQLLIKSIKYVDYGVSSENFLVHIDFDYQERPDPFSDYRAGFGIRTTRRCRAIRVTTHTMDGQVYPVREYRFSYISDPHNGLSLLHQLDIIGFDDEKNAYEDEDPNGAYPKQLPPLTFGYTRFEPEKRRFEVVEGRELPTRALSAPDMEMVDLHGSGLPDILEMNGTVRYWRNLGNGRFDMPRWMQESPPHSLADPGVQMIDADGDGRMDLMVTSGPLAGYYSLEHGARWSKKSFRRYAYSPGFNLDDPEVKLVDLDGDGYTDILRSGSRLECFFNDPDANLAWKRNNFAERRGLDVFPNVNFSDPRVRLADMNGDGLQDIVLIHDGNVEYWPNLGHNRWGDRISMRHSPRYRDSGYDMGYDPNRILLGDVDGDGMADLVYVGHNEVRLWINRSGNGWSKEPIVIRGTPPVTGMDHVRLVDLHGTGVSGVLWSTDATGNSRQNMMFLDFTGGIKPFVLNEMNNHMGAVTRVEYKPSTFYFVMDRQKPATRWRTPLPFPVQVVSKVEIIDELSGGKVTTEYRYHHGYWDGAEREFRGFGMVEQSDTESFTDYHGAGLHEDPDAFKPVPEKQFSPPLLSKTWFHQGPVGEESGDWQESDYTHEYWQEDPQLLGHTDEVNNFLNNYNDRGDTNMPSPGNRRIKRDALRTLRGSILRIELYARDGSTRRDRPYTVTEHAYGLEEIDKPSGNAGRKRIFFPHPVAQRTTQWERGDDPMTMFTFTSYLDDSGEFDLYGRPHRKSVITMPRLSGNHNSITGAVVGTVRPNETRVSATQNHTEYAMPSHDGPYIHDRVSQVRTYELLNPPAGPDNSDDPVTYALLKQSNKAFQILDLFKNIGNRRLIGHEIHHYDGLDFVGLPAGEIGRYGMLIRSETLVFTDTMLDAAYGERRPSYLEGPATLPANAPSDFGTNAGYRFDNESYFADTLRLKHSPRGLPIAMQDALGHETIVDYDYPHHLMPVRVTDAKGMSVTAIYNMRLLQPENMVEPNGSSTHIVYNPSGLPEKQFVVGRDAQGNPTLGGTEERPEITFTYDFLHFERERKPVFVRSIRRIHHALDNLTDDTIESLEYSDGFGRLIQTRTHAGDLIFDESGGNVGLTAQGDGVPAAAIGYRISDSVVVSGWERFNNKGQVVEKYEPFFSEGWAFQPESEARKGRHISLSYDPRGRVIRTLNPDRSQQRVIFGKPANPDSFTLTASDLASTDVPDSFVPTPWESYSYDTNDLAGLTHPENSSVSESHYFTPAWVVFDGLGRALCTIACNGASAADRHITRSSYDIRGNLLTVEDTLGREAFKYHYDLLDRVLMVDSIDAGRGTSVFNAVGSLIEYRDSKETLILHTYDELNRLKELWARNDRTGAFSLRERIHYGDEATHALSRRHNTLGRPVKHYDEAGVMEMPEYDFKGNLLEKFRRTVRDDALANHWQADWSAMDAEDTLEDQSYRTSYRYDALNRPIEISYPEDVKGERKKLVPSYNRAGALEAVKLGNDEYVRQISYNARGQRVLIAYGNGIMTRHLYDENTFRLVRLRTERFLYSVGTDEKTETWIGNGQLLQDFSYNYDLAGNIVGITESVPGCGVQNNPEALLFPEFGAGLGSGDLLIRRFGYDPLYRLVSATGRESIHIPVPRPHGDYRFGRFDRPGTGAVLPENASNAVRIYSETYTYDPAGNMLSLQHSSGWKRRFGMGGFTPEQWTQKLSTLPGDVPVSWGSEGNRLTNLGNEDQARNHHFDAVGNLIRRNTDKHHFWDHSNRMIGFEVRANHNSPPSIEARYLYGADGMRVKKWVRNQQGHADTTIYIDGIFEERHWQKDGGGRNNSLHIMDGQSRIGIVRIGPRHPGDAGEPVQYHLGDHLGCNHVVVGGETASSNGFISREEYFPYGETSLGSFGLKRYRYNGKELDEESGLYYYGARYLAPWSCRWVSCDPAGPMDNLNLYPFARMSPLVFRDKQGFFSNREANEVKNLDASMKEFSAWEQQVKIEVKPEVRAGNELFGPRSPHAEPSDRMKLRVFNHDFTAPTEDQIIKSVPGHKGAFSYTRAFGRYIDVGGFPLDTKHFFKLTEVASVKGEWLAGVISLQEEYYQSLDPRPAAMTSAFSPEDLLSNKLGIIFSRHLSSEKDIAPALANFLSEASELFRTNDIKDPKYFTDKDIENLRSIIKEHYGKEDFRDFRAGSKLYNDRSQRTRAEQIRDNLNEGWFTPHKWGLQLYGIAK